MQKKIGFGIIGVGAITKIHAMAIEKSENCYLRACYDLQEERVQKFATEKNCLGYTNIDEFLADKEVQAIIIATPSGYHLDPAIKALKAGKNVLIEKPLEITPERCDLLIKTARENGVKLGGIFQSRFYEASRLVKKAIDEGRFGQLVMVEACVKWFRAQSYYDSGAWRGTWAVDGGGSLMNQGIHAVDLLCWFGGKVKEVKAFTATLAHERIEVDDVATAVLKFENGGMGIIETSTAIYPGFNKRLEILGTKGSVVMEEETILSWKFEEETDEDEKIRAKYESERSSGGSADPLAINYEGHMFQFDDFALAIIEDREPFVNGEEAAVAVDVINRIYEDAGTKKA